MYGEVFVHCMEGMAFRKGVMGKCCCYTFGTSDILKGQNWSLNPKRLYHHHLKTLKGTRTWKHVAPSSVYTSLVNALQSRRLTDIIHKLTVSCLWNIPTSINSITPTAQDNIPISGTVLIHASQLFFNGPLPSFTTQSPNRARIPPSYQPPFITLLYPPTHPPNRPCPTKNSPKMTGGRFLEAESVTLAFSMSMACYVRLTVAFGNARMEACVEIWGGCGMVGSGVVNSSSSTDIFSIVPFQNPTPPLLWNIFSKSPPPFLTVPQKTQNWKPHSSIKVLCSVSKIPISHMIHSFTYPYSPSTTISHPLPNWKPNTKKQNKKKIYLAPTNLLLCLHAKTVHR